MSKIRAKTLIIIRKVMISYQRKKVKEKEMYAELLMKLITITVLVLKL